MTELDLESTGEAEGSARSGVLRICAVLVVAWLPVLFGSGVMQHAAQLYQLADAGNAYWQPAHALLLYLAVPLVTLSALVFVLSPGLLAALAVGNARNVGEWLLQGFAASIVLLAFGNTLVHALTDRTLSRGLFIAVVVLTAAVAAVAALLRSRREPQPLPVSWPRDRAALLLAAVAPALILAALIPKFLWENFNGDGAHAYEAARLLLTQPVPFWSPAAGAVASWPGTTSMLFTYPTSWFIALFGPYEVSARVPVLLDLVLVFAGVLAVSTYRRGRMLDAAEQSLVWLGLLIYTVAIGFSATYNPYSADLALPGTQDTLVVVCFLGFLLATQRRSVVWLFIWGVFTFLTLPNGLVLIGLWWVGIALFWRPRPFALLAIIAAVAVSCVVLGAILPRITEAAGFPAPGEELGAGALLGRFTWLQVTDWRRILYFVVPCGILPTLSLFWWKRQDDFLRAVTLTVIGYFFITYIQAYASLHYYIPAMLLPLVVFWSIDWMRNRPRGVRLGVTALASVVALILSWPRYAAPDSSARKVGFAVEDRVGGYEHSSPAQFRSAELLSSLFPFDWDPRVPAKSYGGSALVWNYYAHIKHTAAGNYILQRADDLASIDAHLVTQRDGFALMVRDSAVWAKHLALRPPSPAGARIYQMSRSMLFRSGSDDIRIFNTKAIFRRLLHKQRRNRAQP